MSAPKSSEPAKRDNQTPFQKFIDSKPVDYFILAVIIINCGFMAGADPKSDFEPPYAYYGNQNTYSFVPFIIFTNTYIIRNMDYKYYIHIRMFFTYISIWFCYIYNGSMAYSRFYCCTCIID